MRYFLTLILVAILVVSCDKDYNRIGSNIVGEDHFSSSVRSDFTIKTENNKFVSGVNPVQTNGLPYNILGVYNDPVYGVTQSNILAQVGLVSYNPNFGENPILKKVRLEVPYYSTLLQSNEDGSSDYELDSLYGNTPINLKIYRSNYFLADFDADEDFEERQKYYSDEKSTFESSGAMFQLLHEETGFYPDKEEIETVTTIVDSEGEDITNTDYATPRMNFTLDNSDFEWIFNPDNSDALVSSGSLKNYFRGLYFKVQSEVPNQGVLMGLDLSSALIQLDYVNRKYTVDEAGDPVDEDGDGVQDFVDTEAEFKMFLNGNIVNTFDTAGTYTEDLDKLYLKGGQGSMAIINLFDRDSEGNSVELDELRANNWLINEANLEFYVDRETTQGGETEPERIFIYDMDNNRVLLDYLFDPSSSGTDVNNQKIKHLGRLERDEFKKGVKYRIGLTEHVTSIIKTDSTNVRLGLVVSNNVTSLSNYAVKNAVSPSATELNSSSILSHRGTVLFNEDSSDEDKKLKLKIYYTEED